ncbi:MAG TPA: ParA family protein [Polyangiaceae bacterium]|nr:ParA family protein [Polyangiaceae bacterium]
MEGANKTTHVIAVTNQKGGVAKTTNCINLAAALAELGRVSLIVDLDMTAGATKVLGAPTTGWVSTYELLTGAEAPVDCIITDQDAEVKLPKGIHLIPSSRKLVELDQFLSKDAWVVPQDILVEPIKQLRGRYDYIFLDTPPQITKTTVPAYKAADFVLLSALPTHLSTEGLAEALKDIHSAQKYGNQDLQLLGVIISGVRRPLTRLARQLVEYVEKKITAPDGSSLKFKSDVSLSVKLQDAEKQHQTILDYAGDSEIAEQYRAIAREMEARIRKWRIEPAAAPQSAVDQDQSKATNIGEAVNA